MESEPEMDHETIETNDQEVGSEDDVQMFDEDDEPPGNPADEAEEVPAPAAEGEAKVIKPKRVIKNPQPKLDALRLMGPRGLGILQSSFKDVKFKGKGHEKEDLNLLMKKLEHWAHRLFPKLPFDDTLKQIEKLGAKKQVQNLIKRIRLDMFQSDEMNVVDNRDNDEAPNTEVEEVDVFDELLNTGPFAEKRPEPISSQNLNMVLPISQVVKPTVLTPEQRERMERNRLLALERRRAKLLEQQRENKAKNATFVENSHVTSSVFDETTISSTPEIVNNSPFKNSNGVPLNNRLIESTKMCTTTAIDNSNPSNSLTVVTCGNDNKSLSIVEDKSEKSADNDSDAEIDSTKIIQQDENTVKQTVNNVNLITVDDMIGLINTEESNS